MTRGGRPTAPEVSRRRIRLWPMPGTPGQNGPMQVGTPDPESGWLSDDDLEFVRRRVPMLYVEAIPVRLDAAGAVEHLGLLLRANEDGVMTRAFVSGRVNYGESVRSALMRHLEKDLGPMALPQLPPAIVPFTVAEYAPMPWGKLVDERQHAVALVFVVPVAGECDPRQDALELSWLTPQEALDPDLLDELEGGRSRILRTAIGHLGGWP
ncbi:hypothetical protein USB125703_00475 [Pseudoclavibacter triregionum]|nr:hypothetical protein USB125703_00475 [Pseudoclavibacter triregionum]